MAIGSTKAPIIKNGSALSYSWVSLYARTIWRILPMSAGLLLAFLRAFSAFLAAAAAFFVSARLSACLPVWVGGPLPVRPLASAMRRPLSSHVLCHELSRACVPTLRGLPREGCGAPSPDDRAGRRGRTNGPADRS